MFKETYYHTRSEYNCDGINTKTDELFIHYIGKCENYFHGKYSFVFANCLIANNSTMYLIKCSMPSEENHDYGMDLINGRINLDANLEMDKYSKRIMIYAIGSQVKGNKDEPLYLIIDENTPNDKFILKYVDPDTGNDFVETPVPVNGLEMKITGF